MKGNFTYRFLYHKTHAVRYISHLDFVRLLTRSVRRSGMPVTYTQGFNPHPVMTVALPISVGVTSECEYLDIGFDERLPAEQVLAAFTRAFPPGIVLKHVWLLEPHHALFRDIDSACYRVNAEFAHAAEVDLDALLARESIIVDKKSKRMTKETDIKPDILMFEKVKQDGKFAEFLLQTSAGNERTIKPELVICALERYLPPVKVEFMQVHRLQILSGGKPLY